MKNKKHQISYIILSVTIFVLLMFSVYQKYEMNKKNILLSNVYDSALFASLDALKNAQYKLEKAVLSSSNTQRNELLLSVSSDARTITDCLSLLPNAGPAVSNTLKYANQLGDYALSIVKKEDMNENEQKNAFLLIDTSGTLYNMLSDFKNGKNTESNTQALKEISDIHSPFVGSDEENQINYPTLIYDGPFSDAKSTGKMLALSDREISRQEAEEIAKNFVGKNRIIGAVQGNDTNGFLGTYGVTIRTQDVTLEVHVTKKGGRVLFMSPDGAGFEKVYTIETCRDSAQNFLTSQGFPNMHPTYFQSYDGLFTINFAPKQGNCLLYPDLIKVQVRMDNAEIIGFESKNYLMNHTARSSLVPTLSEEEAKEKLSPLLKISKIQLTLIPKNKAEILAYECTGSYKDSTYLVYIDAKNGEQKDILKLIEDSNGLLTV